AAALAVVLAVAGHLHRAGDRVTATQSVTTDHVHGDVDVVGSRQVAGRADERVVVQHVEDDRDRLQDVVAPHLRLTLARAPPAAIALATAAAATAAAPSVVITVLTVTAGAVVAAALIGLVVAAALLIAVAALVALVVA